MKKLFVLLGFIWLLLPNSLLAQRHNFSTFSIEEGLPQSDIYSLIQDQRGYLWVGTGGGLSCFDGRSFTTMGQEAGLDGKPIRSLMEDSEGRIWIGTRESILIYDGKRFSEINASHGLSGKTVLCFLEDSNGGFWAGTDDGGLNRIQLKGTEPANIEVFNDTSGMRSNFVFDLYEDKEGKIWAATFEGIHIFSLLGESVEIDVIRAGNGIPTNAILAIDEDKEGNLWFGSYDVGAFKVKGAPRSDSADVISYFRTREGYEADRVWDIHCSKKTGEVWLATGQHGVLRYHPKAGNNQPAYFENFREASGLVSDQILCVLEDREGNLWMGTNGDGLIKMAGDHFDHFMESDGLLENNIQGITQDSTGAYWLATDGGGISKLTFQNGEPVFQNYTVDSGLTSNFVVDISVGEYSQNKKLWIATAAEGACSFDGETFQSFSEREGLISDRVNCMLVDARGIIWIGSAVGITRFDGSRLINLSMQDMMFEDSGVNAIIEDHAGNIWFATSGGLAKYPGDGSITTFDEVEGLKDKNLNSLTEGPRGNIWIGTNGGGLYKLDIHSEDSMPISRVIDDKMLSTNTINSLVFLDDTTLLLGTNKGFDKVILNDQQRVRSVKSYDQSDGFSGVECNVNAIFKDDLDQVWFGTVKGLSRYKPGNESSSLETPKTHITDLRLFFKSVDWNEHTQGGTLPWFDLPENLLLPHHKNHLTFYFSGLSLTNPEKVRYRYMLEGLDEDWSPPSEETKVTYSGLSHGTYTFKVIACNANGDWNEEPTTLTFTIWPPWYQTTWFYISCVIVLIIGIYIFVRLRERKLQQEKEVLEQKVEERTREVVKQKEEIEHKNKEITDSIYYASRIQEAILPLDDDVDRLLPESFIFFRPKDIVSGDFYWLTHRDNKVLFTAADCTGHGVPGAFMSMIGTAFLNESVNDKGITKPSDVLEQVRKGIIDALKQRGDASQKDGMDMALCALHPQSLKLEFSGANNPLYIIRKVGSPLMNVEGDSFDPNMEEEGLNLFEIKANKQPVGYHTGGMHPFKNHELQLEPGDTVFTFSDGFPDQFGGPKGKKFMYRRFKRLLLSIHAESLEKQREVLISTIDEWMGKEEQVDDICVLGVRV